MTGDELKAIRASLHLTQRALADALGCEPTYISRMERGIRPVPRMVAYAVMWISATTVVR